MTDIGDNPHVGSEVIPATERIIQETSLDDMSDQELEAFLVDASY